jgi:hypothetical protein
MLMLKTTLSQKSVAEAIASLIETPTADEVIPLPLDPRVAPQVAAVIL